MNDEVDELGLDPKHSLLMEGARNPDQEQGISQIREALGKGAELNRPLAGQTALYWAADARRHRAAQFLIDCGATPDADAHVRSEAGDEDTSLHTAAENGDDRMMRILLAAKHADAIRYCDYVGRMPLAVAAEENHLEVARLLIEAGADVNARCERVSGDPPLAYAVMDAGVEMVESLLGAGADPNIPGWMGVTPTMHAQQREGDIGKKMLELLIASGGQIT